MCLLKDIVLLLLCGNYEMSWVLTQPKQFNVKTFTIHVGDIGELSAIELINKPNIVFN